MPASTLKLGRIAPPPEKRASLPLYAAMAPSLPAPPASVALPKPVKDWGMDGNDQIGDCTIAAVDHLVRAWTAATLGKVVSIPESTIETVYSLLSGWDPVTGANDRGCVETDVLDYWMKQGIGGHKLTAYASINARNRVHMKQAIACYGGIYLGVMLPQSAMTQFKRNKPWTLSWFPGPILGGHAVVAVAYDPKWLYCVTWGGLEPVTWNWWNRYGDMAYAPLSPDWIGGDGKSPRGLTAEELGADLRSVEN